MTGTQALYTGVPIPMTEMQAPMQADLGKKKKKVKKVKKKN